MAQIVNFNTFKSVERLRANFGDNWLYVGRANPHYGFKGSPLANPFRPKQRGSGETVAAYRRWLWQQIRRGHPAVMQTLALIDAETALVCWCHPRPCHAEVIAQAAAWLQAQPQEAHMSIHVFVTGPVNANNETFIARKLDKLLSQTAGKPTLMHGGYTPKSRHGRPAPRGTDAIVQAYAAERGLATVEFKANFRDFGPHALTRRNDTILDTATHLVVFHHGQLMAWQADLVAQARQKGLPTRLIRIKRDVSRQYLQS